MLPSLVTLINGICGFSAIILVSKGPGHFVAAAYLIFAGMVADMLDGQLARMSHSASNFGGQLDSLCDMITFGVAPAFIAYSILTSHYEDMVGSSAIIMGKFIARSIWLAGFLYVACAAIRLARFNVENTEDESAHKSFSGLPSPAAAGAIASLILFYQEVIADPDIDPGLIATVKMALLYVLPFMTMAVAALMVSRVHYPHFVNQYLRGKRPVTHLIWAGFLIGLIYLCGLRIALAVTFNVYAIWGLSRWIYKRLTRNKQRPQQPLQPQVDQKKGRG